MQTDSPQNEAAAPVDEATKAVIEEARAAARRGEIVTLEQSDINLEKGYHAWLKSQSVALPV